MNCNIQETISTNGEGVPEKNSISGSGSEDESHIKVVLSDPSKTTDNGVAIHQNPQTYSWTFLLREHEKQAADNGCTKCKVYTNQDSQTPHTTEQERNQHLSIYANYRCSMCLISSDSACHIEEHLKKAHRLKCDHCGQQFPYGLNLHYHECLKCPLCPVIFESIAELTNHKNNVNHKFCKEHNVWVDDIVDLENPHSQCVMQDQATGLKACRIRHRSDGHSRTEQISNPNYVDMQIQHESTHQQNGNSQQNPDREVPKIECNLICRQRSKDNFINQQNSIGIARTDDLSNPRNDRKRPNSYNAKTNPHKSIFRNTNISSNRQPSQNIRQNLNHRNGRSALNVHAQSSGKFSKGHQQLQGSRTSRSSVEEPNSRPAHSLAQSSDIFVKLPQTAKPQSPSKTSPILDLKAVKTYRCHICAKVFRSERDLSKHILNVHIC